MTVELSSSNTSSVAGYTGVTASTDSTSVLPAFSKPSEAASTAVKADPVVNPVVSKDEPASTVTLNRAQIETFRNATQGEKKATITNANSSSNEESTAKTTTTSANSPNLALDASQAKQELARKQVELREAESSSRSINQDLDESESDEFSEAEVRQIQYQIRQAQKLERSLQQEVKQQESQVAEFERGTSSAGGSVTESVAGEAKDGAKGSAIFSLSATGDSPQAETDSKSTVSNGSADSASAVSLAQFNLNFNAAPSADEKESSKDSDATDSAEDESETAADRFRDANKINEKVYTDYFSRKSSTEFIENIDTYFNPQNG
ncbi:MAG: hypothetical protein COB04_06810 [Gammaproteobacteria bacterium]|nr:MAG: hypothetical protein COB04_06810 [Gammaproteobacteria bacterium]